nr:MAG TPA: hypothetical protein [Caudoviricetes sp.]
MNIFRELSCIIHYRLSFHPYQHKFHILFSEQATHQ